jgi:hypothetical protein
MEKMKKSSLITLGVFGGLVGTLVSFWAFQALTNNPSSEWVIPQTAFGDFEVAESDLTNDEIYGDEIVPEFIDDLYFNEYVKYGDQYIVGHFIERNFLYDGMARYYEEYALSIFSSTGVDLWTYTFEFSEPYAIAVSLESGNNFDRAMGIEHMVIEGDSLFLVIEIAHRITYNDWVADEVVTVDSGDTFNPLGTSNESKNFLQSFVRFDIEAKTFHVVGVNEADENLFDYEDFERIEPYRYVIAQEFDNENDEAFTHVYYGETLTFTEFTYSIALLTEITVHPTLYTATFQTKGKWSSTGSVDIDLDPIRNTKEERMPIDTYGLMDLDIEMELYSYDDEERINALFTADDNILTSAQQTLIDNASTRFIEDETITELEYSIYAVLDEDFNVISQDILERVETNTSNDTYAFTSIYWITDNRFVYLTNEEEFNNNGLLVGGDCVLHFKTGNTITKTFSFESYGEVSLFEFFMDDAGNMILAGNFVGNEANPIVDYDRSVVIFMNKEFEILDDFIIDGEGAGHYLEGIFIDENQLRIYVNIYDHIGLFENIDINEWDVVITLALI